MFIVKISETLVNTSTPYSIFERKAVLLRNKGLQSSLSSKECCPMECSIPSIKIIVTTVVYQPQARQAGITLRFSVQFVDIVPIV